MQFHEVDISEKEEKYILECLRTGSISGRGKNTLWVEKELERVLGADKVLMTTSGTHALELAIRLSELGPGDEVILPSYTFPSTANAVLAVGAKPVLVPVDKDTLSMTLQAVQNHVSDRTKAVIAVHYGGVCHDLELLSDYCKKEKITLIEDAAQAFGSIYKGRALGTYGSFGCLSFHGTKNDVAGEGGALVLPRITQDNLQLVELAERMIEKGTDRIAFMRGDRAKYEWRGYGSSYVPSDLLMALLRGQLESFELRMEKRRHVVRTYNQAFSKYKSKKLQIFNGFEGEYDPKTPQSIGLSNGHVFYLIFAKVESAKRFKTEMDNKKVPVRQHFMPLHASEMGKQLGYSKDVMDFEKDLFERLYRLPVHTKLSELDLKYIIEATEGAIQAALYSNA